MALAGEHNKNILGGTSAGSRRLRPVVHRYIKASLSGAAARSAVPAAVFAANVAAGFRAFAVIAESVADAVAPTVVSSLR